MFHLKQSMDNILILSCCTEFVYFSWQTKVLCRIQIDNNSSGSWQLAIILPDTDWQQCYRIQIDSSAEESILTTVMQDLDWQQCSRIQIDNSSAGSRLTTVLPDPDWQQFCRIQIDNSSAGSRLTTVLQDLVWQQCCMIQIDNNSEDLLDNMNAVILTMSPVLHFFARVLCLRRIAFRKDIIAILASLTSFAKNKNGIFV
jgi:hypothetical protein